MEARQRKQERRKFFNEQRKKQRRENPSWQCHVDPVVEEPSVMEPDTALMSRLNAQSENASEQFSEMNSFLNENYVFMNGLANNQNNTVQHLNNFFASIGSMRLPEYNLDQQVQDLITETETILGNNQVPLVSQYSNPSLIRTTRDVNQNQNTQQHNGESSSSTSNTVSIRYSLFKNHPSFQSVWDEWHGLNLFSPAHNSSITFSGGIDGLEKDYKGWRKAFKSAEAKLFSRTKFLIGHVKSQNNIPSAIEQMNQLYLQHSKSIHALEKRLKKDLQV